MPTVVMYSTGFCPYCVRARMLLDHKRVIYTAIRVDLEPELRAEMIQRSGRTSVPQIFIDDFHVGGCDDMYALERQGRLDPLLHETE
jgi:glutaredoxin 3